jgi:hypothetical protein
MSEHFDEEQLSTLRHLRTNLYVGGGVGAVAGFLIGSCCVGATHIRALPALAKYRSRNIATFVLLLFPAIGVYVGSTVAGTNSLQSLQGIFAGSFDSVNIPVAEPLKIATEQPSENRVVGTNANDRFPSSTESSFMRRREHLQTLQRQRRLEEQAPPSLSLSQPQSEQSSRGRDRS